MIILISSWSGGLGGLRHPLSETLLGACPFLKAHRLCCQNVWTTAKNRNLGTLWLPVPGTISNDQVNQKAADKQATCWNPIISFKTRFVNLASPTVAVVEDAETAQTSIDGVNLIQQIPLISQLLTCFLAISWTSEEPWLVGIGS